MNKKAKVIVGSIVILAILIGGYLYLDSILFDGVKPQSINDNARFFAKSDVKNQPAVVLIGGGNWGDYWGQELAKANYVGLSLSYYRHAGLPELMEEIPLEYFEESINWLSERPEVDPDKIVLMGSSRNAELALVIASYYPEIVHGVIAYSPSSVSWSNTVLPFNSDAIKPSWTYKGKPVPFIPMEKLHGGQSDTLETLEYWSKGLEDDDAVNKAFIEVENINGPILLFSGLDDEVWPAAMMSDMIERRFEKDEFDFEFQNIKYDNAGHLISGNPNNPSSLRHGKILIDGKRYNFSYGGTAEGDMSAQKDAQKRVFQFLSKLGDE